MRVLLSAAAVILFSVSNLLIFWIYANNNCPAAPRHYENVPSLGNEGIGGDKGDVSSVNYCSPVHIAFVVAGSGAVRDVAVVIKSMLFYRHGPLHFHFISDSVARHSLDVLLQTWSLPSVNYSFYSVKDIEPNVSWIPNAHYSGVFGLMKLTLPTVLAIDKVIVMDIDLTIASDVQSLWELFARIVEQSKLIGLVENQSDWYLGTIWKNHKPWPALGRGFNTGVMLMNLQEMRRNNWSEMWRKIAKLTLSVQKYTSLADQDIINAVIKWYPGIVYELPCGWNVQLSDHSRSADCYLNKTTYHILHWNSPKKLNTEYQNSQFFRQLHYSFMHYDGTHSRTSLTYCQKLASDGFTTESATGACGHDSGKPFRTHLYFHGTEMSSTDSYDVGLVSQLSMDRLQTLDMILQHWAGPVSLALYATDADAWKFLDYLNASSIARKKWNLSVHVVYKETNRLYPVNYLRNVALNASYTPFVFLTDIDFVPMYKLYSYLREAVNVLRSGALKRALVVPAFESLQYNLGYPNDKYTLLNAIQEGKVATFRHNVWERGHSATNYNKWYDAANPYKIHWSQDYEPYIVVARNVSRFDERFTGFGWNKVSHIIQLDAEGYQFVALPDAFTIHFPHSPSVDIQHYRANKQYRKCQRKLKDEFIREMIKKYGTKAKKYSS